MKDNNQGGSTPDTITVNGKTFTNTLSIGDLEDLIAVAVRMVKRLVPDEQFIRTLTADYQRSTFKAVATVETELDKIARAAFVRGIDLDLKGDEG